MINKNILIAGGSGLVGKGLTNFLINKGMQVNWLSRKTNKTNSPKGVKVFFWDTSNHTVDLEAFKNVDVIINLAGQNIAGKKWSKQYKEKIIKSRTDSSLTLIKGIKASQVNINHYIGASAIGYFGMKIDTKNYSETDEPGNDFLANTCLKWEDSYKEFYKLSNYVSILRFGLILSNKGGFYPKIAKSFKFGIGTSLAPGFQRMPIIHIEDVNRAIYFLIDHPQLSSVYNLVSDIQPTYDEMAKKIAKHLHKLLLPIRVPEWLLDLILGEQHKMLTTGIHINNNKIKEAGFKFKYNSLEEALENLK